MTQTVPVFTVETADAGASGSWQQNEGPLTIHPTEKPGESRYLDEILSVLLLTDGDMSETVLSQEVGLDLPSLRVFLLELESEGSILCIDKTQEEWVIPAIA